MNKWELIEDVEKIGIYNLNLFGNKVKSIPTKTAIKLIKQLDEPEKPVVPQFVADWIEECKAKRKSLLGALLYTPEGVNSWVGNSENQETFARAWLDGYTIEEKRYMVKVKNVSDRYGTLNCNKRSKRFILSSPEENSLYDTKFTRKQLEAAGFGEVFNSPLFEVEEVKE